MGDVIAMSANDFGLTKEELGQFDENDTSMLDGVTGNYAIISYRGKVWRIKQGKDEVALLNEDKEPIPSLKAIILAAGSEVNRTYYMKQYAEGDDAVPDCTSLAGDVPDSGVPNPQSTACNGCPQDAFGSRVSENGVEAKACSEARRLVIVPADDIENERHGGPMLLKVPGNSMRKSLADYARFLRSIKVAPHSVVTRIGFDPDASYPRLTFTADPKATRALTPDSKAAIMAHKNGGLIDLILKPNVRAAAPKQLDQAEELLAAVEAQPTENHTRPAPEPEVVAAAPEQEPEPEPKLADPDSAKVQEIEKGEVDDLLDNLL